MGKYYIVRGPRGLGNCFGYYKENLLEKDFYAVVKDTEYVNGGHGPSDATGYQYPTYESALKALKKLEGKLEKQNE